MLGGLAEGREQRLNLIKHRVNRSADLQSLTPELGVEIDLRSNAGSPGEIFLAHDPWSSGERLEDWLGKFREKGLRGPLILNTKEDGLEERALSLLEKAGIENFFFLDTALPTLVRYAKSARREKFCVRVSSFEPLEQAASFGKDPLWAWIDCFAGVPLPTHIVLGLPEDWRVCLVSPELQGRDRTAISEFRRHFASCASRISAVCTKLPEEWLSF
jgi:hypothetical protein